MRIVHVTKKYPNALGGDAVVVSNLEKQQRLKGHTVKIITSNCVDVKDGRNIYKFGLKDSSSGLDKITFRRLISLIGLFVTAYKVLKKERPDVIHTHSIDMAFIISFAARHFHIPIIHTFHAVTFYDSHQSFLRRKTELILLKLTKTSQIVVLNPFDVQKFKHAGFSNAVFVPNGINLDDWKLKSRGVNDRFTFVAVGRLEIEKGFEDLIFAAARLKKKNSNFILLIVGEGSLHQRLTMLIDELNLNDNVVLVGKVGKSKLCDIYKYADYLVVSSLWECAPLVVLEAWASKLPVITRRVGWAKTTGFIDEDVMIVRSDSVISLSKSMERALTEPELSYKLASNGYARVLEYQWSAICNLLIEYYVKSISKAHKIVQVFPYYPPHLGGAEQRVRDLSEQLATGGTTVEVLTSDQATHPHAVIKGSLTVNYLKSLLVANTPIIPAIFIRCLRQPKGSIFHIHTGLAFSPELAFLAAKIRRSPTIVHIRGDVEPSQGIGKVLLPIYKYLVLRTIIRHADKVIVLTDDYINFIHETYGVDKARIIAIPNASKFSVQKNTKKDINSPPGILLVGRLVKQKNIPQAIVAISELRKKGLNVKLTIAGDGELEESLVKLAHDLDISKDVSFVGRLDGEKLKKEYIKCDIVLQTSFYEGFSSVLIEAMASGRPVIATDILGTRSIVKNEYNGLLINPYSSESATSALYKLITNTKLRNKLVSNGYSELSKYKWDEVVAKTKNVYEELKTPI